MYILLQKSVIDDKRKYLVSYSYTAILKYIYSFDYIKMIDDYHFKNEELYFVIKLGEVI